MGQPGWIPDWFGNNGRSVIDPLFRTRCVLNTNNYGCYNSRRTDRLIAEAKAAPTAKAAGVFWLRADRQIMSDAAAVPLVAQQSPKYASPEVHEAGVAHGVVFLPQHRRPRPHQRLDQALARGGHEELPVLALGLLVCDAAGIAGPVITTVAQDTVLGHRGC